MESYNAQKTTKTLIDSGIQFETENVSISTTNACGNRLGFQSFIDCNEHIKFSKIKVQNEVQGRNHIP